MCFHSRPQAFNHYLWNSSSVFISLKIVTFWKCQNKGSKAMWMMCVLVGPFFSCSEPVSSEACDLCLSSCCGLGCTGWLMALAFWVKVAASALGPPQLLRPCESAQWRSAKLDSRLLITARELTLCTNLLPCSSSHQCIAVSGWGIHSISHLNWLIADTPIRIKSIIVLVPWNEMECLSDEHATLPGSCSISNSSSSCRLFAFC